MQTSGEHSITNIGNTEYQNEMSPIIQSPSVAEKMARAVHLNMVDTTSLDQASTSQ